jgi:transcriptional regulator with XRE-family HTH domain
MQERQYSPINEKIKARRLELGFSDLEVAHRIHQSIYEYGDIESQAEELFTVVPLYHVKKLCDILRTDYFVFFEKSCAFCKENITHLDEYWLPRDLLVRKKRNDLKISPEELGDKVGFYRNEIELIETYTAHLESWVIDNIIVLASQLSIPLQVLLDIQCPNCYR